MMRTLVTLCLALWGASTIADVHQPPKLPPKAQLFDHRKCSDNETKEEGYCFLFVEKNGDMWLIMYQDDDPKLMRYVPKGEAYITIWTAPDYALY